MHDDSNNLLTEPMCIYLDVAGGKAVAGTSTEIRSLPCLSGESDVDM